MDVCAKLRGKFHEKRVGHGGTLDPMATGVLPVFLGRATRAVEYATGSTKQYVAGLRLGMVTNTQDTSGEVLEQRPVLAKREDVAAALAGFRGELEQIPPMYSAVKKDGKKLYELARKGIEVERKPRPVTIYGLELLGEDGENGDYRLRVTCSKGTYVRTLCHDIGQALGCGGCMSSLRRTQAAGYTLEDAVCLEQVLEDPAPEKWLRGTDTCFRSYPALTISDRAAFKARNGSPFPTRAADGYYRVYDGTGEFLLLGRAEAGRMGTIKSFFEV